MTTSLIYNPFTPIPLSEKSHVRGWAMLWAQRLDATIGTKKTNPIDYKTVYLDHGVNFSGSLNLFGGFDDEVVERCIAMLVGFKKFDMKIVSLDWSIFDCNYETQIQKRIGAKTTSEMLDQKMVDMIEEMLDSCTTLTMEKLDLKKKILGDSHTLAFSLPDQKIIRHNGKTLYSVIHSGLIDFINDNGGPGIELDLCLGSIDIRHHVFRHDVNPKEFANTYAEEVIKAQDHFETAINVCFPVPVETEVRNIPKTGHYDGSPFYGSAEDRRDFTMRFIDQLDGYVDFDTVSPPESWYDMDPKKYEKEIMELSSSVHIAPKNYRSILGWN